MQSDEDLMDYDETDKVEMERLRKLDKEAEQKELEKLGIIAPEANIAQKWNGKRGHSEPPIHCTDAKIPVHEFPIIERALAASEQDPEETCGMCHNSLCSGIEEHSNCAAITLADLHPTLAVMDKLRNVRIETLGELISLMIAKDVPIAQIRNWATNRSTHGPDFLLKFSSNQTPSSQEFISIISLWIDRCDFAFHSLRASGCKKIKFLIPKENKGYPFQKAIENAIEDVKARSVLGLSKVIHSPFIVFGDSVGEVMKNKLEAEIFLERSYTALSNEIVTTYFGEEVKEILIMAGTDDIIENMPNEETKRAIQKITFHLSKFSIKTFIIPPPFISKKSVAHEKFLNLLDEIVPKSGNVILALTRGHRSIAEITRYGDKEENRNVDENGKLKDGGAKITLKFLEALFGMKTPLNRHFLIHAERKKMKTNPNNRQT